VDFWLCVWAKCHIEKNASLLENNMWTSGCVYGQNVILKKITSLLENNMWTSGCVYGQNVILKKNYIIVRKQHVDYRMHMVTLNVHVVTDSNSTMQSNYRTSRIPKYCCQNRYRSVSIFHSWNQVFRIINFLGRSPNTNPA
jgi:hypothetical protein